MVTWEAASSQRMWSLLGKVACNYFKRRFRRRDYTNHGCSKMGPDAASPYSWEKALLAQVAYMVHLSPALNWGENKEEPWGKFLSLWRWHIPFTCSRNRVLSYDPLKVYKHLQGEEIFDRRGFFNLAKKKRHNEIQWLKAEVRQIQAILSRDLVDSPSLLKSLRR